MKYESRKLLILKGGFNTTSTNFSKDIHLSIGLENLLKKSIELKFKCLLTESSWLAWNSTHSLSLIWDHRTIQFSQDILLHIKFWYLATVQSIALTAYCLNSPEIQYLAIIKTRSSKISYNILMHKIFWYNVWKKYCFNCLKLESARKPFKLSLKLGLK